MTNVSYRVALGCVLLISVTPLKAQDAFKPKLRLAIASFKERIMQPQIYFYDHDGVGQGKFLGGVPPVNKRSDHHPTLTADGKTCVYCYEIEGQSGVIAGWSLSTNSAIAYPQIHDGDVAHMSPSISTNGQLIAFDTWRRRGAAGRWDVMVFHVATNTVELPAGLNTSTFDERKPALSGNGGLLAYSTNARDGLGQNDIRLYDRKTQVVSLIPEVNSIGSESEPSLSFDGRLLAFISDRDGGEGNRDIYVYDLLERQFLTLPGINSPGQEQSPSLSADGRFLTFVSERLDGVGERDILLYDLVQRRLCPTPDLNSARDEYDPYVITLPETP